MTTAQVVETSVTVNNNSPIQDYVHPDDQTQPFELLTLLDFNCCIRLYILLQCFCVLLEAMSRSFTEGKQLL